MYPVTMSFEDIAHYQEAVGWCTEQYGQPGPRWTSTTNFNFETGVSKGVFTFTMENDAALFKLFLTR